jgi:signal transduction histidine kinase
LATKWKKCRAVIGFAAFVLAFFQLSVTVLTACKVFLSYDARAMEVFEDVFETDFQNTAAFRRNIAERLDYHIFTAVAGDEPDLEGIESWSALQWNSYQGLRLQNDLIVAAGLGGADRIKDFDSLREYLKRIQYLKNRIEQEDKNIVFAVFKDGSLRKSNNNQRIHWNKMNTTLSEDYNFLLYFDGQKVYGIKDGQYVPFYDDQNYTEHFAYTFNRQIPGYSSGLVQAMAERLEVYLAVRREPTEYHLSHAPVGTSSTIDIGFSLPSVAANQNIRIALYLYAAFAVLGLVSLLVYLLLRRDKTAADQWLAQKTARIHLEWKLLLCLSAAVALIALCVKPSIPDFWLIVLCFLLFCPFYLLCNEIRYQKDSLENSFIAQIYAGNLRYPVSRRFSRIFLLPVAEAALMLAAAVGATSFAVTRHADKLLIVLLPCAIAFLVLLASLLLGARHTGKTAVQLEAVLDQLHCMSQGEPVRPLPAVPDADLWEAMDDLNHIQQGFETALQETIRSERMKVELITNVSHDIKTPLTSIVSYIDLMKQEELSPETADYVRILEQKTRRLKEMFQDLFDISKAATHQLPLKEERLDFGKLMRQTLADMDDRISASPFIIRTDIPEAPAPIHADGQRLYRVFQNLIENALSYSLEGSRIYITLKEENGWFTAAVKNTSKTELPDGVDFTERFVRGDESRTDGGSGLGLSIAKSFTEACGGTLRVTTDADLFTAEVSFPKAEKTGTALCPETP